MKEENFSEFEGFVATCEIFLYVKLCVCVRRGGGGGMVSFGSDISEQVFSAKILFSTNSRNFFSLESFFCYTVPSVYLTLPNITHVCDNSNSLEGAKGSRLAFAHLIYHVLT